ncbi:MAG: hypothetical protein V4726_14390 [Verrucomicrobiota bacterium]
MILTLAAGALAAAPALAAPYADGDLILGFVAAEGTGADQTLLVNLGPSSGYRDAFDAGTNKLNFVTIGPRLATQFGAAWHDRTDLYVSLFGVTSSSVTAATLFSRDPARTLYVSQPRISAGTPGAADSGGCSIPGNTAMTGSAIPMVQVSQRYAEATADAAGVVIIDDAKATTLDEFTRPVAASSFSNFNDGIEQIFAAGSWGTLGDAGAVEAALDLYRLQARSDIAGQYGQEEIIREGVYKGTITVSQGGAVSFIAKGNAPADGFNTWAAAKGLPSGVAADDDRDSDGIPALTEYGLDLNPLAFDALPAPVPAEGGGGLQFTFTKGAAAGMDPKITYQVEHSSTLNADWTALTATVNDATKISALLPAGDPSGRRFGRLKIIKSN